MKEEVANIINWTILIVGIIVIIAIFLKVTGVI